ncbi:hypothetical protein B0H13DRAFT_1566400, partial [Mycena leptocephala]
YYEYALLDGRRITPTTRSTRNKAGSSIIRAWFKNGEERVACVGEVRAIFVHRQLEIPHSDDTALIVVEWLVESDYTPLNADSFIWDTKLCANSFHLLSYDTFETVHKRPDSALTEPGSRPLVMPLSAVHCQASRGTLEHTDPPLWITT